MVGVAGKSEGCINCRRRKIKCDASRPRCRRCAVSGLDCEGFAKYPVFIVRTPTGVRKRVPLEEAKPTLPQGDGTIARRSESLTTSTCGSNTVGDEQKVSCGPQIATFYTSWLFETFARRPPSRSALRSPAMWLSYVFELPTPEPVLQETLLAVAVSRYGKLHGNTALCKEGRRLYTRALGLLQNALSDPRQALHDDILATTALMGLHELSAPTNHPSEGFRNHMFGISRLLIHRGPAAHSSHLARSLLEHVRYLWMVECLSQRRACQLSNDPWLTDPWHGMSKDVEQQVFDQGLKLASLYERFDSSVTLCLEDQFRSFLDTIKDCKVIEETTRRLREYSIDPNADFFSPEASTHEQHSTDFPALLLSITAIGIQLGACVTACDAFAKLAESPNDRASLLDDLARWKHSFPETSLQRMRRELAKLVVPRAQSYMSGPVREVAASRLMFALRLARTQFCPRDAELVMCDWLIARLEPLQRRHGILLTGK